MIFIGFLLGLGFALVFGLLYNFLNDYQKLKGNTDGLEDLVLRLEYKLDYVINECNKRGFDLEEEIYYDDDDWKKIY